MLNASTPLHARLRLLPVLICTSIDVHDDRERPPSRTSLPATYARLPALRSVGLPPDVVFELVAAGSVSKVYTAPSSPRVPSSLDARVFLFASRRCSALSP
jgi:hypothetical protein